MAERFFIRREPAQFVAEQFDPGRPWPSGMRPWPSATGLTPRDMSFGYIDDVAGGVTHVCAGDWVVRDTETGEVFVVRRDAFEKMFVEVKP